MKYSEKRDINSPIIPASLGEVRYFLLHFDKTSKNMNTPLWLASMEQKQWDALQEWVLGEPSIDGQTADGAGWLHHCIRNGAPTALAIYGMRRLGPEWALPDKDGLTPLHLPAALVLSQAMAMRWWSERRRWDDLNKPMSPQTAANLEGRADLARHWDVWMGAKRPMA
jgi:hypothetical protein